MSRIYINNKKADCNTIKAMIEAISNKTILTEKGGFLLKVTVLTDYIYIGIIPNFINGERTYHYDIEIGIENEFTLIGAINHQQIFTLLFKPINPILTSKAKEQYYTVYREFADFLFTNGYNNTGELDWITQKILTESEVCSNSVKTLKELIHEQPCNKDKVNYW